MISTPDSLIEALCAAQATDDGPGKTSSELVAETGMGLHRVRTRLHELKAQGRLRVHRVLRPGLSGKNVPHTTYELIDE